MFMSDVNCANRNASSRCCRTSLAASSCCTRRTVASSAFGRRRGAHRGRLLIARGANLVSQLLFERHQRPFDSLFDGCAVERLAQGWRWLPVAIQPVVTVKSIRTRSHLQIGDTQSRGEHEDRGGGLRPRWHSSPPLRRPQHLRGLLLGFLDDREIRARRRAAPISASSARTSPSAVTSSAQRAHVSRCASTRCRVAASTSPYR